MYQSISVLYLTSEKDMIMVRLYIIYKLNRQHTNVSRGTNGPLFPLTENTDGAAVYQVQQQHLFISKLHRLTLG